MDEEIKAAEEASEAIESEVNTQEEAPTTEQTAEEAIAHEFADQTPAQVRDQIAETEGDSKKSAQSRIKELNTRAKQAEEKAQSLADKLAQLTGSNEPQGYTPYTPQYQPGQEVDSEQLSQDVTKTAQAIVELQIKQNNAVNRINNESKDVIRKYSQLDPSSENFDRELSDTITEATEAYVRAQPYTASVEKFVDKLMKPYQRAVSKEVGKATENIVKQVSETALRPTSIRKPEKTANEKSIEELEAELGVVTN
jgi:hypothetical protein